LIIENEGSDAVFFNLKYNGKWTTIQLQGGAVGTYIW
jgi:hypothetical protein